MRNTSYNRGSQNNTNIPWKWISVVGGIVFILILVRIFGGSNSVESEDYLTISPGDQSSVYISMTSASKNRITSEQKLFASDKSVSVEVGSALARNDAVLIDLDKGTELEYKASSQSGNIIALPKGRAWIQDITKPLKVDLKNYSIEVPLGSILLIEQNGPYSNTYALSGNVSVVTTIGTLTLEPGNTLSLLKSDLVNPGTDLKEWIRPIEGAILEYPLFVRNNGISLLGQSQMNLSPTTQSGSLSNNSGTTSVSQVNQYIEITEPKGGIMTKNSTISVMGNILSKDVKRVTLNNIEATVSPVNETFVLQNMVITSEIFDIVYKAYDTNNSILQSGVVTIFGNKNNINTNTTLVPETFAVSTKDFKITFPLENPYSTTESFIKVQGSIPKGVVDYIVVNDFRLQKFVPKSGAWYYFANMATGTMKEGLNLYTIKFYKEDGTLLYTQPFTIIKETKNATISGE